MCTATWLHTPDGFHLFHNRDELLTRLPALPPRRILREGTSILAPIDGDAGGTWIGVNQYQLAACLLNRYDPNPNIGPFISRGELVLQALTTANPTNAIARIGALPLTSFQPFTLVLLFPNGPAQLLEWNGQALAHNPNGDSCQPLASTTLDVDKVRAARAAAFNALPTPHTPSILQQFHCSHDNGLASICVNRPDIGVRTVSFTHVEVSLNPNLTQLTYHPAPPNQPAEDVILTLG